MGRRREETATPYLPAQLPPGNDPARASWSLQADFSSQSGRTWGKQDHHLLIAASKAPSEKYWKGAKMLYPVNGFKRLYN
uniref:Uncharacterized protein n=1 Tax=Thermogemmatispora argillosa TaxID=2045280 RepID=A0A455T7W4_9CHLR|nr:hypothetical protein KTA_37360 [Thermogemmatispora argillosa]